MNGVDHVDILLGRIDRQRSELWRLKEKRALTAARIKELEAENERLRGRIAAIEKPHNTWIVKVPSGWGWSNFKVVPTGETTFCNCSTCNRMRMEGLV